MANIWDSGLCAVVDADTREIMASGGQVEREYYIALDKGTEDQFLASFGESDFRECTCGSGQHWSECKSNSEYCG